jgi:hypothetical protein
MRLAGNEEGKGEGGKGDGDGDEGGGRQRGNGNGGNGGRRAMVMATKWVMVTATRVGEGGGRRNGQWRRRQERWQWRQVGGQATASRAMARAAVTRWQGPPRQQRSTSGVAGSTTAIVAGAASDVGGTKARSLLRRSVKFGIGDKSSSNPFSRR